MIYKVLSDFTNKRDKWSEKLHTFQDFVIKYGFTSEFTYADFDASPA